jgi:hypothetical protein
LGAGVEVLGAARVSSRPAVKMSGRSLRGSARSSPRRPWGRRSRASGTQPEFEIPFNGESLLDER